MKLVDVPIAITATHEEFLPHRWTKDGQLEMLYRGEWFPHARRDLHRILVDDGWQPIKPLSPEVKCAHCGYSLKWPSPVFCDMHREGYSPPAPEPEVAEWEVIERIGGFSVGTRFKMRRVKP